MQTESLITAGAPYFSNKTSFCRVCGKVLEAGSFCSKECYFDSVRYHRSRCGSAPASRSAWNRARSFLAQHAEFHGQHRTL